MSYVAFMLLSASPLLFPLYSLWHGSCQQPGMAPMDSLDSCVLAHGRTEAEGTVTECTHWRRRVSSYERGKAKKSPMLGDDGRTGRKNAPGQRFDSTSTHQPFIATQIPFSALYQHILQFFLPSLIPLRKPS